MACSRVRFICILSVSTLCVRFKLMQSRFCDQKIYSFPRMRTILLLTRNSLLFWLFWPRPCALLSIQIYGLLLPPPLYSSDTFHRKYEPLNYVSSTFSMVDLPIQLPAGASKRNVEDRKCCRVLDRV